MNKKERARLEQFLLVLAGLFHTCDQWTRVLIPFFQWTVLPPTSFQIIVILTGLGWIATGLGTLLIAYLMEIIGVKKTAVICIIVTALYQVLITQIHDLWMFIALEVLLVFNNMPMVIDSYVGQLEGEDGDDKKRCLLLAKLTIPQSVSFALGPYLAIQIFVTISSSVAHCQILCAFISLSTMTPLVYFGFPDSNEKTEVRIAPPSFSEYIALIRNERTLISSLLLLMVVGPYQAYDAVVRAQLSGLAIQDPTNMIYVCMILGGTTLIVNTFIYPHLQARFQPHQVLCSSFGALIVSYVYLGFAGENYLALLAGLCFQVTFVALAVGELSSQILSTITRKNSGKVAALLRSVNLLGAGMPPLVAGILLDHSEMGLLCQVAALASLIGLIIVYKFGKIMKSHSTYLPMSALSHNGLSKYE